MGGGLYSAKRSVSRIQQEPPGPCQAVGDNTCSGKLAIITPELTCQNFFQENGTKNLTHIYVVKSVTLFTLLSYQHIGAVHGMPNYPYGTTRAGTRFRAAAERLADDYLRRIGIRDNGMRQLAIAGITAGLQRGATNFRGLIPYIRNAIPNIPVVDPLFMARSFRDAMVSITGEMTRPGLSAPAPSTLPGVGGAGASMTSPQTQTNMMLRRPAPGSSTKTVKRHKSKGNMSGLDPNTVQTYPRLTVSMPTDKTLLRSSFAQFRKWFDGHRVLTNAFSFVMESTQGKRGNLLIPLRCDPCIYGGKTETQDTTDNYYRYVTGAAWGGDVNLPDPVDGKKVQDVGAAGHYQHVVGDLMRTGYSDSTVCEPVTKNLDLSIIGNSAYEKTATAKHMIVPGLTSLHLEAASWKLNNMKVIQQPKLRTQTDAANQQSLDDVRPLAVLGNWDTTKALGNNTVYPLSASNTISRRYNGARQQNWLNVEPISEPGSPLYGGPFTEQYDVQVGKGYIEFTVKNEGTRQAVVELVLFKPNTNAFNKPNLIDAQASDEIAPNIAENVWYWLNRQNGEQYVQNIMNTRSKMLHKRVGPTNTNLNGYDVPRSDDILVNPYVNFLPESSFKNVTGNSQALKRPWMMSANNSGGIDINSTIAAEPSTSTSNIDEVEGGELNDGTAVGRWKNPYSSIGRAFAAVPAQGKRTIRIPLPKLRYNPSTSSDYSKLSDDYAIRPQDGTSTVLYPTIMNPNSIMVAMSLNGSRSDFFETQGEEAKFRGQDFTAAKVYVDAVYKETVYPCAMDTQETKTAFNFGVPFGTNLGDVPVGSTYWPGVVQDAANVQNTVSFGPGAEAGVVRTPGT